MENTPRVRIPKPRLMNHSPHWREYPDPRGDDEDVETRPRQQIMKLATVCREGHGSAITEGMQ